jgi:hypothetical protein
MIVSVHIHVCVFKMGITALLHYVDVKSESHMLCYGLNVCILLA